MNGATFQDTIPIPTNVSSCSSLDLLNIILLKSSLVEDHGRRARGSATLSVHWNLPLKSHYHQRPNQTRRNTLLKKKPAYQATVVYWPVRRCVPYFHSTRGWRTNGLSTRTPGHRQRWELMLPVISCVHAMKRNHQPCEPSKFPSPLPVSGSERC